MECMSQIAPLVTFAAALVAASACGGAGSPAPTQASTRVTAGVALAVEPTTATVLVDDETLGPASSLDPVLALEPGLHTLVVSQDGYQSYRAEFTVTDRIEHFDVRLAPLP
jgi:hypothetical protein